MTPEDEHDPLPRMIDGLRGRVEQIHAARVPDFAAMMARAHELDATVVTADAAAQAEALAPVIPIEHGQRDHADDAAVLAPFTAATRDQLAARDPLAARDRVAAIPTIAPRRRRLAVLAVGLAAVAAALLLSQAPQRLARLLIAPGGGLALADRHEDPTQRTAPPQPGHTDPRAHHARPATIPALDEAEATPSTPATSPALDEAPGEPTTPATSPALDEAPGEPTTPPALDEAEPTTPAPTATRRSPERAAAPAKTPRAPSDADADSPAPPSSSLEDEAQALWQRGELAAAEQKFREVVRRAGMTARAELAYGDLFALAGQLRGADGQVALAREYLAAFPRGRFADDMRAGLCQRAATAARPACWRDYLERHADGSHRRAAEAALANGPLP